LPAAKNSVKRAAKLKMPVSLRLAGDGKRVFGDSASGKLPAVGTGDGPISAALWAADGWWHFMRPRLALPTSGPMTNGSSLSYGDRVRQRRRATPRLHLASADVDERSVVGKSQVFILDTFVKRDKVLLIFLSMAVLCISMLNYISLHNNYVILTIVDGFIFVLACGFVALIVLIRVIRLKILKSPALLACVALLLMYPLIASFVSYTIDQLRFQSNESFYLAQVKMSNSSPKFVVFDWGSSGFLSTRNSYFLVFDENGSLKNESRNPVDLSVTDEPTQECRHSVRQLSDRFYSVEIAC
jgi:hypothetical protein